MDSDQTIRICHLASGDLWAGAEVQIHTLLSTLNRNPKIKLSAIILNNGQLVEKLISCGIDVNLIDESKYSFLEILDKLRTHLLANRPDILHTHRYKENILGGLAKKSEHVNKLVQTVHGLQESFDGLKRLKIEIYSTLNRYYSKKYFDSMVAVSRDIERHLNRQFKGKMTVIHNAVELDKLNVNEDMIRLKEELELKKHIPVIGSVGRMVRIKGYDLFLKMAQLILKKNPEVQFLLVGDGPLKSDLESLASKLGISSSVRFSGFRNDIVDIFSCMDIFVMSSHHEGIPTVLLEAMALGKPVVSTAVGGIPEVIENENCGILVKSNEAQLLADACLELLIDSDRMRKMAVSARQRIENKFSSTSQSHRMIELYLNLVNTL